MSNHQILDKFKQHHPIMITKPVLIQLDSFCRGFETRREHAQALNTMLLGIHDIHFLPVDQDQLFHIMGVDLTQFKRTIAVIPTIDPSWNVSSDPYNHLTVWAAHNIMHTKGVPVHDLNQGLLTLFKLMHYKFFTSLMFRYFPHRAQMAAMTKAIHSLTKKFDLVKLGTWAKVMEDRSRDIYASGSIHYNTLYRFDDDKAIVYVITDAQTRIRQKIKLVVAEYHKFHQEGDGIGSYSNIGEDADGEKVIGNTTDKTDLMIANITRQVMSIPAFVDPPLTRYVSGMFTNVRTDMFRAILERFSEMATVQAQSDQLDLMVKDKRKEPIYRGARLLIQELIQKTFRHCQHNGTNMRSKADIIIKVKHVFSSSRGSDPDLLTIKRSVMDFVVGCGESTREATLASLCLCFIMYIIIRALDYYTI